jgi:phospholipid/cholesterol/gamma-HCH transport system permease protein
MNVLINNNKLERFFIKFGELLKLYRDTFVCTFTRPFYLHRLMEQIVIIGVGSLAISTVIGFTIGLVMTLQFGHGLATFGGTLYVPSIVSVSLMRELAPILTSLLVAGRIGSGITAELGSMAVTQQIDAIRALGTSPIRVLVVPRMLAAVISLPFLSIYAGFMGLIGGMLISDLEFGISYGFYINKVIDYLHFYDVLSAIIKSAFFGMVITGIAAYKGFKTKDGTRGVGQSTTWVVVTSSITIMISDFFLSKLLIIFLGT